MCREKKKCAAGEWGENHGKLLLQLSRSELLVLSVPMVIIAALDILMDIPPVSYQLLLPG